MDETDIHSLLEDLGGDIDQLESSLEPLLKSTLSSTTSRLPLLDKAKLYVLATYAIESLLFSYLRLNGVDAKEHAVFRELTRVKEYFEKIKAAEAGPTKRSAAVDRAAAGRFIRQGLAGNNQYDRERLAREQSKRRADESQWGSHNRFESTAKRIKSQDATMVPVVRADDDNEDEEESVGSTTLMTKEEKKAAKRQRRLEARLAKQSPASNPPHADDPEAGQTGSISAISTAKPDGSNDTHAASHAVPGDAAQGEQRVKKKRKRKSRGEMRQELEDKRAQEMS